MLEVFDATGVKAWAVACVRELDALRAEIDGINVYPVADGDTGSNLLHTMTGARDALLAEDDGADPAAALAVFARGAVEAARGNSGVIISQVLRGFAESAEPGTPLDGPALARAFARADAAATGSVTKPVDGTMLTVLHAVAEHAGHGTLAEVADTAVTSATTALAETPRQLPVLATAGVVDAGGRGLLAVLAALRAVICGDGRLSGQAPMAAVVPERTPRPPTTWEVMYLLDGADETALPGLRTALSGIGDSVTVAGDGFGRHAVHVHCADIGAAIEAGIGVGRPTRIRVEPLHTEPAPEPARVDRSVAAVVRGAELAELLRAEGVNVLTAEPGQTPSIEQLLALIAGNAGRQVTLLPSAPDLTAAADAAAAHPMAAEREPVVIPCASPVQVLAALAVHDPARRTHDDVVAMAEAAAATRRGEILVAQEDALTWIGRARAGDVVGLIDGEAVLIEDRVDRLTDVAMSVLNRMLDVGGELVTLITGAWAPEEIGAELAARLRDAHPEVEVGCYPGGQTDAVLLIGVE